MKVKLKMSPEHTCFSFSRNEFYRDLLATTVRVRPNWKLWNALCVYTLVILWYIMSITLPVGKTRPHERARSAEVGGA